MTHRSFASPSPLIALFFLFAAIAHVPAQTPQDAASGEQHFNSGNELLSKGNFAEAIVKYNSASEILPAWHLPFLNRGVANLSLAKYAEAENDAMEAIKRIKPGTPSADEHFGIAYQVIGTARQQVKDYQGAFEFFTLAVEKRPADAKFHNSLGTALRFLGKNEEARSAYSKAVELAPGTAMFLMNRSSMHEKLNDTPAALKDLDEAIRVDRSYANAYYMRAAMRVRSKEYPLALVDYDEAIRLEPRNAFYYHGRALLHHATKKYDLAIKDHTQSISIDPKNTRALNDRASAHYSSGNTKAAIDDARAAAAIDSSSPALNHNLSIHLYNGGQFSEAVATTTRLIERFPNWRGPYIVRSNAYIKLGMQAKAQADRDKLASLKADGRPKEDQYLVFDIDIFVPEEPKP